MLIHSKLILQSSEQETYGSQENVEIAFQIRCLYSHLPFFSRQIFRSFCWDAARYECVRFFLQLALIFINYINYRANLIFNILSFILCLFRLYCSPFPTFSLTFVGHSMNFKWVLLVSKRCSKYGVYFLFAFSTVISGGTKIIGLIISSVVWICSNQLAHSVGWLECKPYTL